MMMYLTFSLPLLALLVVALLARRVHGSWLVPGAFFPLAWFFFTLLPLIMAPEYPVDSLGLWVIVMLVGSFTIGTFLVPTGEVVALSNDQPDRSSPYLYRLNWVILLTVGILSGLSIVTAGLLLLYGFSHYKLEFSWMGLATLPNQFSIDRYDEALNLPLYLKLGMYLVYPASLLAGLGHNLNRVRGRKWLYFLPIISSVIFGVLMSVRSGILIAISLWVAGYLGSRVLFNLNLGRLVRPKSLGGIIIALGSFSVLFVFTQFLRAGLGEIFILDVMIDNAKAAFFGYLSLFTRWVASYELEAISYGRSSLAGVFELAGLGVRRLGFYREIIDLTPYSTSNVFSALRGIVHDFSFLGSIPALALLGFFVNLSFVGCRSGRLFPLIPLTMFYAFTLYSPLISIFNYNSVLTAWVLLATIFLIIPRNSAIA